MIEKNNVHNPWTAEDEKEHFPCEMEWWTVESFFKTVEDDKNWSLKVVFNEGFRKKKIVGSISNITLFDQDNNKYFKCYSRTLSKKLQSRKDRFDDKITNYCPPSLILFEYPAACCGWDGTTAERR